MTKIITENKTRSGYIEISLEEMKEFLESLEFIMHKRDPKTEWVANRIYQSHNNLYLIRVYTSINPEERSRGVGTDAIRVAVFSSDGEWIGGSKRVNRTKNWKRSIESRIKELETKLTEQNERNEKILKDIKQV